MSLIDKGVSVLAWVKTFAVLLLVGALLAVAWWALGQHRRAGAAEYALARAEEARQLAADGLVVAAQDNVQLRSDLAKAKADSATFAAALADAQAKLQSARVISVVSASTGPRPVKPATEPAAPGAPPACALLETDLGEIEVHQATIQTEAGNRVVVGSAEAYRVQPRRWLFGGTFSALLTEASEEAKPASRAPGWGAGGGPDLTVHGLAAHLAAASPEFRVPLIGGTAFALPHGWAGGGDYGAGVIFIYRP